MVSVNVEVSSYIKDKMITKSKLRDQSPMHMTDCFVFPSISYPTGFVLSVH